MEKSVNLRAMKEKKYEIEIKWRMIELTYRSNCKIKSSIEELNQKGRERLLDAFTK